MISLYNSCEIKNHSSWSCLPDASQFPVNITRFSKNEAYIHHDTKLVLKINILWSAACQRNFALYCSHLIPRWIAWVDCRRVWSVCDFPSRIKQEHRTPFASSIINAIDIRVTFIIYRFINILDRLRVCSIIIEWHFGYYRLSILDLIYITHRNGTQK